MRLVRDDPTLGENLAGHIICGEDAPINFNDCPMLFLKVVHHHHIGSPDITMDVSQVVVRLALLQPTDFIEVVGP